MVIDVVVDEVVDKEVTKVAEKVNKELVKEVNEGFVLVDVVIVVEVIIKRWCGAGQWGILHWGYWKRSCTAYIQMAVLQCGWACGSWEHKLERMNSCTGHIHPWAILIFWYTRYFNDISFDAIYRDIFTIICKWKLGQNTPKFHFWSTYVEIFATKWPIYGIFIRKHHT